MNEQPVKPETAEAFEYHLTEYGKKYEEATSRLQWRGGQTGLARVSDSDLDEALKFEEAVTDLKNRIALLTDALGELLNAQRLRAEGQPALEAYQRDLYKLQEENRYREMNEERPELYTLHAVAVKKVMREAQAVAKVKWNKLENYWIPLAVFATVNGLTTEEADKVITDYIEARKMSYTVSTKNLKMKVA